MVVEDNPTDVFLVREALRAQGLEVDLQVFEDGEAAITFVQQLDADDTLDCPSLVLLDVNLPRADGFDSAPMFAKQHEMREHPRDCDDVIGSTHGSDDCDSTTRRCIFPKASQL